MSNHPKNGVLEKLFRFRRKALVNSVGFESLNHHMKWVKSIKYSINRIFKILNQIVKLSNKRTTQYATSLRKYLRMCIISLEDHYVYLISHGNPLYLINYKYITWNFENFKRKDFLSFIFEQEKGKQIKSKVKKVPLVLID